jgi:hypothetical protein
MPKHIFVKPHGLLNYLRIAPTLARACTNKWNTTLKAAETSASFFISEFNYKNLIGCFISRSCFNLSLNLVHLSKSEMKMMAWETGKHSWTKVQSRLVLKFYWSNPDTYMLNFSQWEWPPDTVFTGWQCQILQWMKNRGNRGTNMSGVGKNASG